MSDAGTTMRARSPISEARRLSKSALDHDFECALIHPYGDGHCDCWPIEATYIVRSQRQVRLALAGTTEGQSDG